MFPIVVYSLRWKWLISSLVPKEGAGETHKGSETEFVCRKCRKLLFYDDHLLKHSPQEENDQPNADGDVQGECSFGFLLTPMKWMDLSAYEGKVGFNWMLFILLDVM